MVSSEHGRGVFVRPRPPVRRLASDRFARRHRDEGKSAFTVEAEAAGSRPEVDSLQVREECSTPGISARLGSARKVLARRRRYLLDGKPVEFAVSYLPLDLARNTPIAEPNPGPGGIYARLEELGHRLDHFDEEVRARMPAPDEVKKLRLASGVPVIHLVRTAYDRGTCSGGLRHGDGRRRLRPRLSTPGHLTRQVWTTRRPGAVTWALVVERMTGPNPRSEPGITGRLGPADVAGVMAGVSST